MSDNPAQPVDDPFAGATVGCRHCTVPVDGPGDVCGFCRHYAPPVDSGTIQQGDGNQVDTAAFFSALDAAEPEDVDQDELPKVDFTTHEHRCTHCGDVQQVPCTSTSGDVPLPPGATTSDLWTDWDNKLRVIFTEDRQIDGGTGEAVYASAIQFLDGTINTADGEDLPRIWLGEYTGLSSKQTRSLAADLTELADIVDQWTAVNR